MTDQPLLEVRDMVKQFAVGQGQMLTAVNRVSFTLRRGETLALVGESGSGKTTVGRCVLRLIEPTSGSIHFGGRDLTRLPAKRLREFRREVQVVFQDPADSLDPRMRAGAIVAEAVRELTRLEGAERTRRVHELLDRVGLGVDVARLYPHHLTTSQQQRLGIARALASDPSLLVLDEPTSSLDPLTREEIVGLLRELQREMNTAFLFISHDLVTIRHLCDHIAVMYLGEIVETGPVDSVFERPRHPYTQALLASAPSIERRDRTSDIVLAGEIPSPIDLPTGCFVASRCPFALAGCHETHPQLEPVAPAQDVRCLRVTGQLPALPLAGRAVPSPRIESNLITKPSEGTE